MIIPLAKRLQDVKAYYFVKKLEEIRVMIREGKDVISFAIGSPDLTPSDLAIRALNDAASQDNKHGYQAYKGISELRYAISSYYMDIYGVLLSPHDEVLPLMGSKEGLLHLLLAFINAGDEVLVPNPGYPAYSSLTKLLGGQILQYNLTEDNNWYPDFNELEEFDLNNVKIMFVNYPHMPTGAKASLELFERLVLFAKSNGILLCHDNPYSRVLNQKKPLSILNIDGAKEVAVELNSLSKSHNMAGWRVGMLLGAKEYIDNTLRVKSNIDSGMFYGLQSAAIASLNSSNEWHDLRNEEYHKRRMIIFKILDHLQFNYDHSQEGMFVWAKPKPQSGIVDIPSYIDGLLHKYHIFFTPGMIFGSNGEAYVRLSLCVPRDRIEQAYYRILSL